MRAATVLRAIYATKTTRAAYSRYRRNPHATINREEERGALSTYVRENGLYINIAWKFVCTVALLSSVKEERREEEAPTERKREEKSGEEKRWEERERERVRAYFAIAWQSDFRSSLAAPL